jgi:hypothetical protein
MNPMPSVSAVKESFPEEKVEDKMAGILIVDDQPYVRKLISKSA